MSKPEEKKYLLVFYFTFHEKSDKGTNSGRKAKHCWKASQTLYRTWLTQGVLDKNRPITSQIACFKRNYVFKKAKQFSGVCLPLGVNVHGREMANLGL